MTTKPQTLEWNRHEIRLKYDLGDLTLFEKRFMGILCGAHFLQLDSSVMNDISISLLDDHAVEVAQIISSPLNDNNKTLCIRDGLIVYCTSRYRHHYIDTDCSFDLYQKKFKSKTRSTLKRKVAKFAEGKLESEWFRKFVDPSEMSTFFRLAHQVSAKTYQHHLFGRGLPQDDEFIYRAVEMAKKKLVRGYLLLLNERPVAYTYGPVLKDGVYLFDYNGYDPEFAALSPGNVLQLKTIEDLCNEEGIRVYDLCVGENEHKMLFSSASRDCGDFLVFRMSFSNVIWVTSNLATIWVSKLAGILLRVLNLKNLIKKVIRRNAGKRGYSVTHGEVQSEV